MHCVFSKSRSSHGMSILLPYVRLKPALFTLNNVSSVSVSHYKYPVFSKLIKISCHALIHMHLTLPTLKQTPAAIHICYLTYAFTKLSMTLDIHIFFTQLADQCIALLTYHHSTLIVGSRESNKHFEKRLMPHMFQILTQIYTSDKDIISTCF